MTTYAPRAYSVPMTANEAQNMTGVERAMALDLLDADGVDRLTEDEGGIYIDEVDDDREPDYEPDYDESDMPGYIYNLFFEG